MKWISLPLDIIRVVLILVMTASAGIFGVLLRIFLPPKPVVNVISRYYWSPVMLILTMIRLRVTGRENVSHSVPCVYVSNHCSQLDILVLTRAVTVPLFFVAKEELRKVPVVGQYIATMGMIFIDRRDREKAMASMQKAIERIQSGHNVITFPEGTRAEEGKMLMFKKGTFIIAKEGRIPIVPVAIRGTGKLLPRGAIIPRPGRVDVMIGKPVQPDEFAHLSPEKIAELFRDKIQEMIRA